MELVSRIGTFFLIVGVALVAMYVISDLAGTPDLLLAGLGVLLGTVGLIMRSRYRPEPPPPPGRFTILRGSSKTKASGAEKPGGEKFSGDQNKSSLGAGSQGKPVGKPQGGKPPAGKK